MMTTKLSLNTDGKIVSYDDLRQVVPPPPAGRWHPKSHYEIFDAINGTLLEAGYQIQSVQHSLSHFGHRYFSVLKLTTKLAEGVSLAVGIRNSSDKSSPISFCAGSSVDLYSNLQFRSELLVTRKHTTNSVLNLPRDIAAAVKALGNFAKIEEGRIKRMKALELAPAEASHIFLQAWRQRLITTVELPKVIDEYENPSHEDFRTRNAWSLMNAFAEVLKPRAITHPNKLIATTFALNRLVLPEDVTNK